MLAFKPYINYMCLGSSLISIQGNKSIGYDYIIIGILLLIFSFNRMNRNRNK